ncbi:FMN-dependent NADH-azoreductase [Bradyrhizobium barranii subsp. barranii]|nr:FMN-dependent NADH-azoreductase [Bradyrhizobium japonicum]MCP1960934.1 FMN-dependent NADH-azoreductase [Bradyrhizobium japonicum]
MTKILHLICSPRGQASESYRLSEKILGNLMDSRPTATVIVRPIGGAVANLDERSDRSLNCLPKVLCPGPKS